MSDSDNNSEHSDSENSQSSHQSVETTVSTEEQNRRLKEQVQALTAALKKKDVDRKEIRRKSSTTPKVANVSLSLAQKPKLFEVNSNKNISESKLHEHLETIKSHVSGGNEILRDALAQLFSTNAQQIIVLRYETEIKAHDSQAEDDIFKITTMEFCDLLYDLFPLSHKKNPMDIIRDTAPKFDPRWFEKGSANTNKLQTFVATLWNKLGLFKQAKYVEGNGTVCEATEFPALREAILEILHPESTLSAEDAKNPTLKSTFLTNQQLVDAINKDPPEDLNALRLAIIMCSNDIAAAYQQALDNGWIVPIQSSSKRRHEHANSDKSTHKRRDTRDTRDKDSDTRDKNRVVDDSKTYKGTNPQPFCKKCRHHHDVKKGCRQISSSSSSSSPSSKDKKDKDDKKDNDRKKSWNKPKSNTSSKDKDGENIIVSKDYDKDIDIDSISYFITSNVTPSPLQPPYDMVENYKTHKRPRDIFCDTININITTSDIDLLHNIFDDENNTTGTVPIIVVSQIPSIINTLVDSGSLKSNYIDITLFDRLKAQGVKTVPLSKKRRVCSGLAGVECQEINEYIELFLIFINQSNNKEESIVVQFHPIHMRGSFSLILGLPTIQRYKLAS